MGLKEFVDRGSSRDIYLAILEHGTMVLDMEIVDDTLLVSRPTEHSLIMFELYWLVTLPSQGQFGHVLTLLVGYFKFCLPVDAIWIHNNCLLMRLHSISQ